MRAEGVGDAAIDTFAHYYEQLREGASGMLPESDIEPVEDLPTLDELPEGDPAIVDTAVVLKLNGGLGTSMGMTKAKSLIEAKDGQTLPRHHRRPGARAARALRRARAARAHELVRHARRLARGAAPPPGDRVRRAARLPAEQGAEDRRRRPAAGRRGSADPSLEWAPPGHGDLYTALVTSGMLDDAARARLPLRLRLQLRQPRRRARPADPRLGRPRGAAVRDGGRRAHRGRPQGRPHRAAARTAASCCARRRRRPRRTSRRCRTSAATATSTPTTSGSTSRRCATRCEARDGVLGLPMIVNRKTVDPSDPDSPAGRPARDRDGRGDRRVRGRPRAARPAAALRAGQDDQRPARAALRRLRAARRPSRRARARRATEPPVIDLDPDYYKLVGDFEPRFPAGPPSLVECERLTVVGRRDLRARRRRARRGDRGGAGAHRRWRRTDLIARNCTNCGGAPSA